jgi:hypothetical protein
MSNFDMCTGCFENLALLRLSAATGQSEFPLVCRPTQPRVHRSRDLTCCSTTRQSTSSFISSFHDTRAAPAVRIPHRPAPAGDFEAEAAEGSLLARALERSPQKAVTA